MSKAADFVILVLFVLWALHMLGSCVDTGPIHRFFEKLHRN